MDFDQTDGILSLVSFKTSANHALPTELRSSSFSLEQSSETKEARKKRDWAIHNSNLSDPRG
jgi:hypothetical protein